MLPQKNWTSQVVALLAIFSLVLWAGETMVTAAGVPSLKVTVRGITPGKAIPRGFAFCVPAKTGHVALGLNKSPAIQWSKGPAGTASYAIVMFDPDVPSSGENVNKEGKVVPASLKRVSFYHWILVDIPASVTALPPGADSDGVTPRGKAPGPAQFGVRGVNDYTNWFAGDAQMAGDYGGYDGPCPPWNDAIPHHYHFAVHALNVQHLGLSGKFTGPDALKAMEGHVVAKGEVVGVYALNPTVAKKIGVK